MLIYVTSTLYNFYDILLIINIMQIQNQIVIEVNDYVNNCYKIIYNKLLYNFKYYKLNKHKEYVLKNFILQNTIILSTLFPMLFNNRYIK